MWTSADNFSSLVQVNWEKPVQGCTMFRIVQRLKWLKADLKLLNRAGFGNVEDEDLKMYSLLSLAQARLHANPGKGNASLADEKKQAAKNYKVAHRVIATTFIFFSKLPRSNCWNLVMRVPDCSIRA